jgi:hypothetical protein
MTYATRNPNDLPPAAPAGRCVSAFAVFVLIFLFAAPVGAADGDFELESKVHQALSRKAALKTANLFVRVQGGTATLSGAIASRELKQEAIRSAQSVEGVLTVRADGLYVSSSAQRSKPTIVIPLEDRPTQTRSASPTLTPPRADAGQQIVLLAPEAALLPPRPAEPARLTAHPRPAPPAVDLAPAVEALRQNNPRFQRIRTQVSEATVYIYPNKSSSDDVTSFAQAVRRLSGVQHVVIASASR